MKTIIQLLIAALVINASVQAARSAWRYYSFKDEVHQAVLHGSETTTSELHKRVYDIAESRGIPLGWQDIEVRRSGDLTVVTLAYVEAVPLVPRLYAHEWTYQPEVSARRVRPLRIDDIK